MKVLSYDHYDMPIIESETEPGEYAIAFSDEIADTAAKQYIEDSLWAFNAEFLASKTDMPVEIYKALQPQCEDSNDAITKLVEKTCGLDSFVESAIAADGRGHFMSSYDSEETCFTDMSQEFQNEINQLLEDGDLECDNFNPSDCYVYRIN
jgi:hypothetical protein